MKRIAAIEAKIDTATYCVMATLTLQLFVLLMLLEEIEGGQS